MADEFSYARYMPLVPTGGVMSALPKTGPVASPQEMAAAQAYANNQGYNNMSWGDWLSSAGSNLYNMGKGMVTGQGPGLFHDIIPGAAQSVVDAATLQYRMDQAKAAGQPMTTDQLIPEAMNVAGMVTLGAGAIPAEANALRMGATVKQTSTKAIPTSELATYDPYLNMYSQVENALVKFPKAKGRASDIYKYLVKNGANPEELKILGIGTGSGIVSKAELLDKVRATGANGPLPNVSITTLDPYTSGYDAASLYRGYVADTFTDEKIKPFSSKYSVDLVHITPKGTPEHAQYQAGHFGSVGGAKNLGAHVLRFDVKNEANQTVRQIREVQSDKATDYRKSFPRYEREMAEYKKELELYEKKLAQHNELNENFKKLVDKGVATPEEREYFTSPLPEKPVEPKYTFDTDPYTKSDAWSPLAVKAILSKAAEDGVDILEIPLPETVLTRWEGTRPEGVKALKDYYSKSLPNEFKKWVESKGGKVEKVDRNFYTSSVDQLKNKSISVAGEFNKSLDRKKSLSLEEFIEFDSLPSDVKWRSVFEQDQKQASKKFKEYGAEYRPVDISPEFISMADPINSFEEATRVLRNISYTREGIPLPEVLDTLKRYKQEKLETIADMAPEYKDALDEFNSITKADNTSSMLGLTTRQKVDLQQQIDSQFRTFQANYAEEQHGLNGINLAIALVEKSIKPVKQDIIRMTPDLREKILQEGFPRMAKGGIVDLANYWAQPTTTYQVT